MRSPRVVARRKRASGLAALSHLFNQGIVDVDTSLHQIEARASH
jgi:hypothetical protein